MPRTDALSFSVERRCNLFNPSPIRVSRWSKRRRIGLPICSTTTVLLATLALLNLRPPHWPHRHRDDILDAERFEDGAHWAAGDDPGAGCRGTQDDLASAVPPVHVVVQRA